MSSSPNFKLELEKAWRLGTAFLRARPDFILPGAPKCATSSLYDWLTMHPLVRRASRKEPTNFIHYPTSELRSRMHFPPRIGFGPRFLTGEASVEYFTHPDAARNISVIVRDVRLIFVLRNPIERAWSDFRMFVKSRVETEDFATVIQRSIQWLSDPGLTPLVTSSLKNSFSPVRYLANGLYADVLSRWFQYFPREQCIVIFQEDLFTRLEVVQAAILRHLGLPFVSSIPLPHARKGDTQECLDPEVWELLTDFYRDPDDQLEDLLKIRVPWRQKSW